MNYKDLIKAVLGHAISGFLIGVSTGLIYSETLNYSIKGILIGGLIGALRSVNDFIFNSIDERNIVKVHINRDAYTCIKKPVMERKHFL